MPRERKPPKEVLIVERADDSDERDGRAVTLVLSAIPTDRDMKSLYDYLKNWRGE